ASTGGWPGWCTRTPAPAIRGRAPPSPARRTCGSATRGAARGPGPGDRAGPGYGARVARGDIANLYATTDGLLKIARDPADNDLMRHEEAALRQLTGVVYRFRPYFPRLIWAARDTD